jgi:hypothetical protein
LAAPDQSATFADVVSEMVALCPSDGNGPAYRRSIVGHFARREVVRVTPAADKKAPAITALGHDHIRVQPNGLQDRSACCGTMRLREYSEVEAVFDAELAALAGGVGGQTDSKGRRRSALAGR